MMLLNLSPETAVHSANGNLRFWEELIDFAHDTSFLKQHNLAMAANGATFSRDKIGIIPEIIKEMFQNRKRYKAMRIEVDQELELIKTEISHRGTTKFANVTDVELAELYHNKSNDSAFYEAMQMALKIALNSCYGSCGNDAFRYYSNDIAEGITLTGQLAIKYISKRLNEFLNARFKTVDNDYVIYADTDSVVGSTIISLQHTDMKIEDLFNTINLAPVKNEIDNIVKPVTNLNAHGVDEHGNLVLKPVKYVMAHKVKKELFKITVGNKKVICTSDHSLIVKRDGVTINVKPIDVLESDVFILVDLVETNNFTIESLGVQEEWVYDIEVEDCHNFFGNGILVHNSCYIELNQLVERVVPKGTEPNVIVDFLNKFSEEVITPFIDSQYEKLSEYLNAIENTLNMKREVICDRGIWRAKKNYILQVYDNENVRYAEPKLKSVGIETARTSTPEVIKAELTDCFKVLLNGTEEDIQSRVKQFRTRYMELDVYDIAKPTGVKGFDVWCDIDPESRLSSCKTGTPIHVKASIAFNNLLVKLGLDKEHQHITNGSKVRYVYLKQPNPAFNNAIAFTDELLDEFELNSFVDREIQFEKTFLKPLESFTKLLGWNVIKASSLKGFIKTTSSDNSTLTTKKPSRIIKKSENNVGLNNNLAKFIKKSI